MAVRYIGSKARLVSAIARFIGKPRAGDGVFVEPFCGTGVIAEEAARLGWSVRLNDHLHSAVIMSEARITSASDARFLRLGGYERAIAQLNELAGRRGFVWREYSPASRREVGIARMYFTEENAAKIDAMRSRIGRWTRDNMINRKEQSVLLADLLGATNRAANIAGTYGCFLSHWTTQALEPLRLVPREFFSRRVNREVLVGNAGDVPVAPEDLVYLDPPYTKRQYAAYYHILETIAVGDAPQVEGITGLRPWREKASDFCYRTRALRALRDLVHRLPARRILLSYSSEGHVPLAPLCEELSSVGTVVVHRLMDVGRYRPNRAASDAGAAVSEFLLCIERRASSTSPGTRRAALA